MKASNQVEQFKAEMSESTKEYELKGIGSNTFSIMVLLYICRLDPKP